MLTLLKYLDIFNVIWMNRIQIMSAVHSTKIIIKEFVICVCTDKNIYFKITNKEFPMPKKYERNGRRVKKEIGWRRNDFIEYLFYII